MTMFALSCLCLCVVIAAHAHPPDKTPASHIIRTRSIDISNAHEILTEKRLNSSVEPTYYQIQLEPYLDDGVFKGYVFIDVTWLIDADEIDIHCAPGLGVTEYNITDTEGKDIGVHINKMSREPRNPVAKLHLDKLVLKGSTGRLYFKFNGTMETGSTDGFFKTTYTEQEVERVVVATQLRANNARKVFPCFDEPAFKAKMQLNLVRPRDMVALSNVATVLTKDIVGEPDSVLDVFEVTHPMSTFTFGFVIAKLEKLMKTVRYTDSNSNLLYLNIYGRPEFLPALEGLERRVVEALIYIGDFWKVPQPILHMTIVALPNYQGVKPIDNWGLIVFKESDLANNGYFLLLQEMCYQWLGTFVSPASWSDAHVNKALCSFIAAETTLKINPKELEGKWPMTALYSLYYEYSKRYPHSRITGMKQETTCTKLELLFRMFNTIFGEDTFMRGLRTMIDARQLKSFTEDDIWAALNTAANEDKKIPRNLLLKSVVDSWMSKDRIPFMTVTRDYEKNTLVVKPSVYLRERPHDVPHTGKMIWWVPIVFLRDDKANGSNCRGEVNVWTNGQITIVNMPKKDQYIILNPEEIVPFPVNYDTTNWKLISDYLQSDNRTLIPELTRAKLLHDSWNLAFAGELSFATALDMTLFLRKERNHLVWDPIFTMFDHLGRHTWDIRQKFQAYIIYLLLPLYKELTQHGEENEKNWQKNLRSLSRTFLCQAGWEPCIVESQEQFKKWMESKNPDAGNPIANQYICPVFKYGTEKEWEFGLQRVINFPHSRIQSERTYLLKSLAGCPISDFKIRRILNVTLLEDSGNFTDADVYLVLSMLSGNTHGYTTLIGFLSDNLKFLKEKFYKRGNLWDHLITSATSHFTTESGLNLVSNLYSTHKGQFGSVEYIVKNSMKNIKEEASWSSENVPVIEDWLDSKLQAE